VSEKGVKRDRLHLEERGVSLEMIRLPSEPLKAMLSSWSLQTTDQVTLGLGKRVQNTLQTELKGYSDAHAARKNSHITNV